MNNIYQMAKTLADSMKRSAEPKTEAYDTQAEVRRIEGSTAWVHIPGGVDETPVKLTISAKEGDVVQVRVADGRAFLVGNASAPPTDDSEAIRAMETAKTAEGYSFKAANLAEETSAELKIAEEEISSKVSKGDIISSINQSAEQVSINADKIDLNGAVSANDNFKINEDGSMESIAGDIGGWMISSDSLYRFYSIDVGYGTETEEPTEWENSRNYLMRFAANSAYERPGIEYYQVDSPTTPLGLILDPRFEYNITKNYVPVLGEWEYYRFYPSVPGEGYDAADIIERFKNEYNLYTIYDPLRALFFGVGARESTTGEFLETTQTIISPNEIYLQSVDQSNSANTRISADYIISGNMSTQPATWGEAVTVSGTDGTIANDTNTSLCNTYLDPGLYFIVATARFAGNANGNREIHLSTENNGTAINRYYSSGSKPVSGSGLYGERMYCILSVDVRTRYYLVGYQNSGSSLNVQQRGMMITKIL